MRGLLDYHADIDTAASLRPARSRGAAPHGRLSDAMESIFIDELSARIRRTYLAE
jgi:hypothetical protein